MDSTDVVIQGITGNGKPFRPSDWAERLCGVVGVFEPAQQKLYAPLVQQMDVGGVKCVVIDRALEQMEPRFFRFLLDFARENELQVTSKPHPSAAPTAPSP